MENRYTKAGFTQIIQFVEGKMIDAKMATEKLTAELKSKELILKYYDTMRNNLVNDALEKGIELDPNDFLMEL